MCTSKKAKLFRGVRSQNSRHVGQRMTETPLGLLGHQESMFLDLAAGCAAVFTLCTFPFVCYITTSIYVCIYYTFYLLKIKPVIYQELCGLKAFA